MRFGARWAEFALLVFLGFLLWLLNHPYQGIWHDARVYGLLAAQWLNPGAYARELFFGFGSQGSFSLFTPLYGALVACLGLDRAAWWVTLSGGLLWVGACLALARTMLGTGYGARFAVLFGAVAVFSYSPTRNIFVIGENFASARSWALPLVLASVAALAAQRQAWAVVAGVAATALHPLHGIWALALWVLARMRPASALIMVLLALAILALLGLINPDLPHLRLMTGDWLDFESGEVPDIMFRAPAQSRLPIYLGALVILWLGARRGSEKSRALYWRSVLLGIGGLGIALLASYAFPVEILVQGQAWRVMALLLPLALVALIDVGQRAWQSSVAGRFLVGVVAVLASMGTDGLLGVLCVVALGGLMPSAWIDRIEASGDRWRYWLGAALAMFFLSVVPNILAAWEIAGSQWLNPWWDGAEWLQGLVTGGSWHVAALAALVIGWLEGDALAGAVRKGTTIFVFAAICVLTATTIYHWDRRPEQTRIEQACYLDAGCPPHPFSQWVAPGDVVLWPEGELTVWFELGTASYFGAVQAIGRVFSSAKHYEWQRRQAWVAAGADPHHLCTDPLIDWVVRTYPVPGLSPRATMRRAYLYACGDLRAVSPAPTFSRPVSRSENME